MALENAQLRKRNGELLIQNSNLETENKKLKQQLTFTKNPQREEAAIEKVEVKKQRPKSAFPTRGPKQEAFDLSMFAGEGQSQTGDMLYDEVIDEMDRELEEMLQKGQESLQGLKEDFKKVSRMAEDPSYVNSRKIRQPVI